MRFQLTSLYQSTATLLLAALFLLIATPVARGAPIDPSVSRNHLTATPSDRRSNQTKPPQAIVYTDESEALFRKTRDGDIQQQQSDKSSSLGEHSTATSTEAMRPTHFILSKRFGLGSLLHKHNDGDDGGDNDEKPEDHQQDGGEPDTVATQLTDDHTAATFDDLRPDLASDDRY